MVNAIKVFKKTSPNGEVTAYLECRDFVDHFTHTTPVDGVIVANDEYLKGRKIFVSVRITYRYGREEDEVMGLHFSKEYDLVNEEILPKSDEGEISHVQKKMVEKLGGNARPFTVNLPDNAPTSVSLEPATEDQSKPLGVLYELKFYVAEEKEDKPHRRNSVAFAVRKVQYAPPTNETRQPFTMVHRGFTLSPGQLNLEVSINKDIFFHGQSVETLIKVHNASKRTVKSIAAQIVQHVEITMTNTNFNRIVASIKFCEGCPITPEARFERAIILRPLAYNIKRFGIALDGKIKDEDANLASSTIVATGKSLEDALGIIVSYSIRVKLLCGALSGELSAEVPFKLMHPDPETKESLPTETLEFEEFSKLRRGKSFEE